MDLNDRNDRADDFFRVTVHLDALTGAGSIFQFAATAPGTCQVMDIDRLVSDFQALDDGVCPMSAERPSTDEWRLSDTQRVRVVRYRIAESWGTPANEHPVYIMAGTSPEAGLALISAPTVFGFPALRQGIPVRVRFRCPVQW